MYIAWYDANPSRQGRNPTLPDTSQPGRVSRVKFQQASQAESAGSNSNPARQGNLAPGKATWYRAGEKS
jgi:hypothetical protein